MSKNILIIDDDNSFVAGIINKVSNKNIYFSSADSINRAKIMLNDYNYDLILANVKVPGGSSLELKEEIESVSENLNFIFMSNIDSDYNYVIEKGEKCCHKYELENSVDTLFMSNDN